MKSSFSSIISVTFTQKWNKTSGRYTVDCWNEQTVATTHSLLHHHHYIYFPLLFSFSWSKGEAEEEEKLLLGQQ